MSERAERRGMEHVRSRHSWLFLLEIILSTGIFVIAASVFVLVFVKAGTVQQQAQDLYEANAKIANVLEMIRTSETEVAMMQRLEDEHIAQNLDVVELAEDLPATESTETVQIAAIESEEDDVKTSDVHRVTWQEEDYIITLSYTDTNGLLEGSVTCSKDTEILSIPVTHDFVGE